MPAAVEVDVKALTAKGHATLRGVGSFAAFRQLAQSLGPVIHETTVELRPGARTYLANPETIPPHTDHPAARFIGWYCERQDPTEGAIQLVDGLGVVAALGPQATILERIRLPCPALDSVLPSHPWPMLRKSKGRADLYFAPWREPTAEAHPVERAAYERFRDMTQAAPATAKTSVNLAPGDALFIDNRRILHGRQAIPPDSPRRLRRLWTGD